MTSKSVMAPTIEIFMMGIFILTSLTEMTPLLHAGTLLLSPNILNV